LLVLLQQVHKQLVLMLQYSHGPWQQPEVQLDYKNMSLVK
jgi:hypothetical protein